MTTTRLRDWLEVSTTGFAQRQADRLPAHLIKEVIQNALDAVDGLPNGYVNVTIDVQKKGRKNFVRIHVLDNGPGINDPQELRTLFSTGKADSFLLRGRLGQGIKEVICLCHEADVRSSTYALRFFTEKDQRVCDVQSKLPNSNGTSIMFWMPWETKVIPDLEQYLRGLITPVKTKITVNGQEIPHRKAEHRIDVELKTELFNEGKWVRRDRPGVLELVPPAFPGEEPKIYEMGIPVQEIDWTQPYHVNVLMRVPMNPRRDAVAAGYLKDLYRQVLPVLMPKMEQQELRDEWVSQAIEDAEPEMRKDVVTAAFGTDAVRSVPTLGRHDFDSDAREIGYTPIDTRLLPRGLREATQEVMRTSRDVELERRSTVNLTFSLSPATDEFGPLKAFVAWLAEQLVGIPVDVRIAEELVIKGEPAIAAWAGGGRLSLNKQHLNQWRDPLSEGFLGILVHETAHEQASHHGDDFRDEIQRMAGKLARLCLFRSEEIKTRWPA